MAIIVVNAGVTVTMYFRHDDRPREVFYEKHYYSEIVFTLIFDLEAAFKIWCHGWRGYWKHSIHKFEFLLVVGTTIHIIPGENIFQNFSLLLFMVTLLIFEITSL